LLRFLVRFKLDRSHNKVNSAAAAEEESVGMVLVVDGTDLSAPGESVAVRVDGGKSTHNPRCCRN
jgi:hypothetical protein